MVEIVHPASRANRTQGHDQPYQRFLRDSPQAILRGQIFEPVDEKHKIDKQGDVRWISDSEWIVESIRLWILIAI